MTRASAIAVLFWGLVLALTPELYARSGPTVCLAIQSAPPGLDRAALQVAVSIEERKLGRDIELVVTEAVSGCPALSTSPPTVHGVVGPSPKAVFTDSRAQPFPLDLTSTPPMDRAVEVARTAMALVDFEDAPTETLIDLANPVYQPYQPEPDPVPVGGAVFLGGGYARELGAEGDLGTSELEVALTLWDGQLSIGGLATWAPEQAGSNSRIEARVMRVEAMGMIRGGFWAGPVLLRLGAGAGWLYRELTATPDVLFDPLRVDSSAVSIGLEAEALWPVRDWFALSLTVPGRIFLGGTNHSWRGEDVYAAPTGAVGVQLRAGVLF